MSLSQKIKAKSFLLVFLLSLLPVPQYGRCDQEFPQKPVSFSWAFAAQLENGNAIIPVTRRTVLRSGDKVKIYLRIENGCYGYVIYQSSSNELFLLFPERKEPLDISSQRIGNHYLPSSKRWFELDEHSGTETFHLIASTTRLVNLEKLLNEYGKASVKSKPQLKDEIVSMIKKISRRSNQLTIAAEKPIMLSGNVRSGDAIGIPEFADIKPHIVMLDMSEYFIKTYTITHNPR